MNRVVNDPSREGPAHLSRCSPTAPPQVTFPAMHLHSGLASSMAVIWMCRVSPGHGTHCRLCLEGPAHFVLCSTVAYPSRPSSVSTSSGKHSWKQAPPLCEWGAPYLFTGGPWVSSVLALSRVHLWCFVCFLYCLWTLEDSDSVPFMSFFPVLHRCSSTPKEK